MKYRFVAISQGGAPPEKIFVKHNRKMLSPKFAGRANRQMPIKEDGDGY